MNDGAGSRSAPAFAAAAPCFFAAGSAALIYEIVWSRAVVLLMGSTAYALGALLAVFMGGLAVGARLGGRIASDGPPALRLYGRLQLVLGLYGLVLYFVFDALQPLFGVVYRGLQGSLLGQSLVQLVVLGVLLLVPTALMGAMLPVLTRFAVTRLGSLSRSVGVLYAIHAAGACAAALVAGFYLLPAFGVITTWGIAVALSVVAGGYGLALAGGTSEARGPEPARARPTPSVYPRALLLWGFAVSGFAAMVYQVTWTRGITLSIGSYSQAFALIVAAFILGLALGSLVLGWTGDLGIARWVVAVLPIATGASALLTVPALADLPIEVSRVVVWGRNELEFGWTYFWKVLGVVLLPTLCMGGMLPLVSRLLAAGRADAGRAVGAAFAANAWGTVLGAIAAGFVLIPLLGTRASILVGTGLSVAVGAAFLHRALAPGLRRLAVAPAAAVLLAHGAGIAVVPGWDAAVVTSGPFLNGYAYTGGDANLSDDVIRDRMRQLEVVFLAEDPAGIVSVLEDEEGRLRLAVSGKSEGFSVGGVSRWLGHLPALLRTEDRSALVIGLGAGVTLRSVADHPGIERIDCVEISASVVDAARRHFGKVNGNVLDDSRVRVIVADARQHLEYADRAYDLIVSQPSSPRVAHAAHLYTEECFEAMQRRLRPGGLACLWFGSYRMPPGNFEVLCATWSAVWPHTSVWCCGSPGDYVFVGSDAPLSISYESLAERIKDEKIGAELKELGMPSPAHVLGYLITADDGVRDVGAGAVRCTDDNQRIAFDMPMAIWRRRIVEVFSLFADVRVDPWEYVEAENDEDPGYLENRERGKTLLEVQRRIHDALRLDLARDRDEALLLLQKALELNPLDPIGPTVYQTLLPR